MGMSASEVVVPFLGALQASISVLLTVSYGVIAAQFKLLSSESAKEVSRTCVRLFLPALLITQVGSQLHQDTGVRYIPVLVFGIIYNVISILIGHVFTRAFKLPPWVTPALAFNNTTSLPLLLMQSLASTGILSSILMGPDDTTSAAIDRAQSYFLVNSMISNSLTFAIGPRLLRPHEEDAPDKKAKEQDEPQNGHPYGTDPIQQEEDVENEPIRFLTNTQQQSLDQSDESEQAEGEEHDIHQEARETLVDEETSLMPRRLVQKSNRIQMNGYKRSKRAWNRIPAWGQAVIEFLFAFLNPPLVGAVIGAVIGLVPALHRLCFSDTSEGGYLNAWLTESVSNIGSLFASLQIIVVGVKLSQSLLKMKHGEESGAVPWGSMVFITLVRFILWPLISIPVTWALATKTGLLDRDPVLWFSMMLMPTGPPAMILTALADVNGSGEVEKMSIAKFLTIQYAVTPLLCFSVVGALKATEAAMSGK